MPRKQKKRSPNPRGESAVPGPPPVLRIIGGHMRGRKLLYSGLDRTRPMKDRVREAVFNLVGPAVIGKHVIDLFAGTGALGLEAISRGAARATFIEQHFPTADLIRENATQLGVADRCQVHAGNGFIWAQKLPTQSDLPWVVFCSPPYAFYVDRHADMLELVSTLLAKSPAGSVVVVESDRQFDLADLPEPEAWDIREYPPAVLAIYRKAPVASD